MTATSALHSLNCEKHWSACRPHETGNEIELPVELHFHLPEKSTEDLDRTGDSLLLPESELFK